MANMHFRYGAMGSSKTASALMLAYNFRDKGMIPLVAKPAADTRTDKMWSRIGIETDCITVDELCSKSYNELTGYDCIVVDEAQFATEEQIEFFAEIADHLDVPVFLYGLMTDFQGKLFTGSKRIVELADKLEELETVCWCGNNARFSARIDDTGHIIRDGDVISPEKGKNQPSYVALCRKHYFAGRTGKEDNNA